MIMATINGNEVVLSDGTGLYKILSFQEFKEEMVKFVDEHDIYLRDQNGFPIDITQVIRTEMM